MLLNIRSTYCVIILFFRFHLQLVASYELYNSKRYEESYLEIKSVVKYLETCKFDESNEQYTSAYCHIAWATNAYIALTLKIDSEKVNYIFLNFISI